MKRLSLVLLFFVFGCQSMNPVVTEIKNIGTYDSEYKGGDFSSRNLVTEKFSHKKIKIAIFVPTSGKYNDLGMNIFNSTVLSLFNHDKNQNIELVLIDSKSSAKDARKAFKKVVNEDIKLVIGPIFSSATKAIAQEAQDNEITVISLSNNQTLANNINDDGGVFVAGMLLQSQVDKVVGHVMKSGKLNFSIIAPNNQYGKIVTGIYKKIVRDRDGRFITSNFYNKNSRDLDRIVGKVINSFTIPLHLQDGRNKLKKDVVLSDNDRIYSQVIMVPESGRMLSKIVESINRQNIEEREFQIIGTSQWDNISTLNDTKLQGSLFAAPKNKQFRRFEKIYYRTYGKFPPRLASIAYDSLRAISHLVYLKEEQLPTVGDFINYKDGDINGFNGVDGLFRFLPNGLVERNLAVLEVGNSEFNIIEEPAENFLNY